MPKFDIIIIGAGILGTTLSYWLSSLTDLKICVIDKEFTVARHASSRNTGLIHSPFYIDPDKKKTIAKSSFLSHDLWKSIANKNEIPWLEVGTIEVALNETQHNILEMYLDWGTNNGLNESELSILDQNQISKKEPHVKCYSGLYCTKDVSTNYGLLTNAMKQYSEKNDTSFIFNFEIKYVVNSLDDIKLISKNNDVLIAKFVINCAGGYSLDLAKKFDTANEYASINFRGEYLTASQNHGTLVNTNVYSVPKFLDYPFLDPHWIKKSDGSTEIGPNAIPVPTPETYCGYIENFNDVIRSIFKHINKNTLRLILDSNFLELVSKEFLSSVSKTSMVKRIKKFIPDTNSRYFSNNGTSGIRSQIICPDGTFMNDILEIYNSNSVHILNYNSPGATGAPAYSAFIVKKLYKKGFIKIKNNANGIWNYEKLIDLSN